MLGWIKRYHAGLVQRGETVPDNRRYGQVQIIAGPWMIGLLITIVGTAVIEPFTSGASWGVRVAITLSIMVPLIVGMIYSMCVFLFAAIRADVRRHRATKQAAARD